MNHLSIEQRLAALERQFEPPVMVNADGSPLPRALAGRDYPEGSSSENRTCVFYPNLERQSWHDPQPKDISFGVRPNFQRPEVPVGLDLLDKTSPFSILRDPWEPNPGQITRLSQVLTDHGLWRKIIGYGIKGLSAEERALIKAAVQQPVPQRHD